MAYKNRQRQIEYQRRWMQERRNSFLVNKRCAWCESSEDLEFHHKDPKEKESHRIWSWSLERIRKELSKCIVVCRTCHTKYHAEEKRKPFVHGTTNAYDRKGCRCDKCRKAKTQYKRALRSGTLTT